MCGGGRVCVGGGGRVCVWGGGGCVCGGGGGVCGEGVCGVGGWSGGTCVNKWTGTSYAAQLLADYTV